MLFSTETLNLLLNHMPQIVGNSLLPFFYFFDTGQAGLQLPLTIDLKQIALSDQIVEQIDQKKRIAICTGMNQFGQSGTGLFIN